MFVFHFDLSSLADWGIAIADLALVILTFKFGLPAITQGLATLEHMKTDTNLTLKLFELQNRPYISVLPDISFSDTQKIIYQKNVTSPAVPLTSIAPAKTINFQVKNYGNLPATINGIIISREDKVISGSAVVLAVFPNAIKDCTSREIDNNDLVFVRDGNVVIRDVEIQIHYSINEKSQKYQYKAAGRIVEDGKNYKYVIFAEIYESNDDALITPTIPKT
jgi:hypothetical protein